MNQQELVATLAQLNPSSTFLYIEGYTNLQSEKADFILRFNMSWENALKKSIAFLEEFETTSDLEAQAKNQLLQSWKKSLKKHEETPIEEIDDSYRRFFDPFGKEIKGVKLLRAVDGNAPKLYIFGLLHLKRVIEPVAYKPKNSSALTLCKVKLTSLVPAGRFRQFHFDLSKLSKISIRGLEIIPTAEENVENE